MMFARIVPNRNERLKLFEIEAKTVETTAQAV